MDVTFKKGEFAASRHIRQDFFSSFRSQLCYMEIKDPSNPAALFMEWIKEAENNGAITSLMNLATANSAGEVNNRTVVIREIEPDATLCFNAQARSNKIRDIMENPRVAATLLLLYNKNGLNYAKQIRFRGIAEQLPEEQSRRYFEKDKLPAKIRTVINAECTKADWKDIKAKHDKLLREVVENNKAIEMPETALAFKIIPNEIEFYFAFDDNIADRILFTKSNNTWQYERIMA